MAFAIQWTGPQGLASTRRKDPVDALKYAIEMLGKGYAEVKANELLPVACAAVDSSRLFGGNARARVSWMTLSRTKPPRTCPGQIPFWAGFFFSCNSALNGH
jgi:hypothetical protein